MVPPSTVKQVAVATYSEFRIALDPGGKLSKRLPSTFKRHIGKEPAPSPNNQSASTAPVGMASLAVTVTVWEYAADALGTDGCAHDGLACGGDALNNDGVGGCRRCGGA